MGLMNEISNLTPGQTLTQFNPGTPNRSLPVRCRIINGLTTNPSAYSSTYSSSQANSSPVMKQISDMIFEPRYQIGGELQNQLSDRRRYVFLTETGVGWPWGRAFGNGDQDSDGWNPKTDSSSGFNTNTWMKENGYHVYGIGNLLLYPGGVDAYFDRFMEPTIEHSVYWGFTQKDPQFSPAASSWWSTPNYQVTQRLTNDQKAELRLFAGASILLNCECSLPYTDRHWRTRDGSGFYPAGDYLEGFRLAMIQRDGVDPSNAVIKAEYTSVLTKLMSRVVSKLRALIPGVFIIGYEVPMATPANSFRPDSVGHTKAKQEETDGTWNTFFRLFDSLGIGHLYPFYDVVADNVTPTSSQIRYSDYLFIRSGCAQRLLALREHFIANNIQTKIGATALCTLASGEAVSDLTLLAMAHIAVNSYLDTIVLWGSPGFTSSSKLRQVGSWQGSMSLEQELTISITAASKFVSYLGASLRTPIPGA